MHFHAKRGLLPLSMAFAELPGIRCSRVATARKKPYLKSGGKWNVKNGFNSLGISIRWIQSCLARSRALFRALFVDVSNDLIGKQYEFMGLQEFERLGTSSKNQVYRKEARVKESLAGGR